MAEHPNREVLPVALGVFREAHGPNQDHPGVPALQGVAALEEITYAVQIGWHVPLDIAGQRAKEILQPGDPNFEGARTTCPFKLGLRRGVPVARPERQQEDHSVVSQHDHLRLSAR